jgi:multidrug transporter EmrE-like cation transporter
MLWRHIVMLAQFSISKPTFQGAIVSSATLILILAVILNAVGNVLIKLGMNQVGSLDLSQPFKVLWTIFLNPGVVMGITFFIVALAGYSYTLSRFNLSTAYPIMSSLSFMVVLLISAVFLQERIQLTQLLGCFVILVGVWLVSANSTPSPQTTVAHVPVHLTEGR